MQMPSNIIISRVDSIGDVVLTLPIAGTIKKYFPKTKIGFLCQPYAKPVVQACSFVDETIELNNFMQQTINICGEKPKAILHVLPKAAIAWRAAKLKNTFAHRHYKPPVSLAYVQ